MKKQYILAFITIFFWSTIATVSKLMLSEIDNFQLLWASSFFAFAFLLLVNIFTKKIKAAKEFKAKDWITLVLIGLPGTFFYYVFYYGGAEILPASQAFIINYLWPVMSVVFACILLKEKITVKKCVAFAMSFIGVGIVTGGGLFSFDKNTLAGAGLCILGAVSYGLFTALNQKFSYEKSLAMMVSFLSSFVLTTIINGINGRLFVPGGVQIIGFVWNGMLIMALGSTLWALALESKNTVKISNLAYITPFLSLVWTTLILKEKISIYAILGLVVIILGIFIQLTDKRKS